MKKSRFTNEQIALAFHGSGYSGHLESGSYRPSNEEVLVRSPSASTAEGGRDGKTAHNGVAVGTPVARRPPTQIPASGITAQASYRR